MTLPGKKEKLNPVDERSALKRGDDESCGSLSASQISEEHYTTQDRDSREHNRRAERRHEGHNFDMDLHPERYPREALSRIEEGILGDEELRHADDRLGYAGPDLEHRIDELRSLSRMLLALGSFLLIFAAVLMLWVGWDVRSGHSFFVTMWAVAVVIGLGLVGWGLVERNRIARLLDPMALRRREGFESLASERGVSEDRAA